MSIYDNEQGIRPLFQKVEKLDGMHNQQRLVIGTSWLAVAHSYH